MPRGRPKGSKNKKSGKEPAMPWPKEDEEVLDNFVIANQSLIHSSIKVLGKIYTATGTTIKEAILNLDIGMARGYSILVLEKNGIRKEKVLNNAVTMRLFGRASPTSKEIVAKKVCEMFDKTIFET